MTSKPSKKAKKPRTWWIVQYTPDVMTVHLEETTARAFAAGYDRPRVYHVREVSPKKARKR